MMGDGALSVLIAPFTRLLIEAVDKYLTDKSFLDRRYVIDEVAKYLIADSDSLDGDKRLRDIYLQNAEISSQEGTAGPHLETAEDRWGQAELIQRLNKRYRFVIKVINLKYQLLDIFILPRQSIVNLLTAGFIYAIFRSKLFWGFDKHLWSLGYYRAEIFQIKREYDLFEEDLGRIFQSSDVFADGFRDDRFSTPLVSNDRFVWRLNTSLVYGIFKGGSGFLEEVTSENIKQMQSKIEVKKSYVEQLWLGQTIDG